MSNNNSNSHELPGLPPRLHSEDEAVAIENAIRSAINTVMNVICSACNRRVLDYQRMVADRDKEIRRLECKLEKSESELKLLRVEVSRRQSCDQVSDEPQVKSSGVGVATPTHPSPESHDTAEAFPHLHAQTETPSWGGERAAGCQPFRCISSLVKEEPSDLETPVIKWEVCEGSVLDHQEGQRAAENQCKEKPTRKDMQAECEARTANPQINKPITREEEDEHGTSLKRKDGERNGCCQLESEDNDVIMKKPYVTQQRSSSKTTAPKHSLGDMSPPQPLGHSPNGSMTSHIHVQDPLTCQQQAYISMSAQQSTCDPILLEVLVSLETIKQQNTTVLQILQAGNSSGGLLCEPPDVGALPLPLQSVQDLRSLEHRLSTEPELKKKMTSYLGLAGGMTTKESVWRIMAKLFTNTLAKNINWRGRNNKQKLENLTIARVILNAVRQNSFCKDAVDEEIERYIKRWLQLAGDRDGGRKRRQEKGKETSNMQDYCMDEMFTHVME
ncbi:hypothetical protein INR49_002005 [Caranx melampygus]|nr:hypothetical protein INR49_002005 [Caranx melampygus]